MANLPAAPALARCTERGCPVIYRGGPDRPCPMHVDDGGQLAARAASYGVMMAAVPGERDGTTGERDGGNGDGRQ